MIPSKDDRNGMSPQALERALVETSAQGRPPKAVILVDLYG